MLSEDLHRYERLYSLPEGRFHPSRKNIDHHFKLVKSIKNGGGLNEGINIVKYRKLGNVFVQKKLPIDYEDGLREILFLNVLKHPNIITYIDAYIPLGRSNTGPSLYLEYCELGTLQDLIMAYVARNDRHPRNPQTYIPERFIWHVLESMASALLYMHHGNSPDKYHAINPKNWPSIVHRDIKPDNIFLRKSPDTKYPVVVLADFVGLILPTSRPYLLTSSQGIATNFLEHDFDYRQGCFVGTPEYSPPEGDRQVARADIWALGAVILSLCWLFKLGPKESPPDGVSQRVYEQMLNEAKFKRCIYESETGLDRCYSEDLAWVVGRCTQWKKSNRPLAHTLTKFIEMRKPREFSKGRSNGLPGWAFEKS